MSLYILEQPSSWSTSRIRPSCPRSRVRLNLLLDLFPEVYSCLLWPTQYLAVCFNSSHFALDPFLACWQPNTCVQVNNTPALHHIHEDTHLYITLILFILLLYTSSTLSGRPADLDPSRQAQWHPLPPDHCCTFYNQTIPSSCLVYWQVSSDHWWRSVAITQHSQHYFQICKNPPKHAFLELKYEKDAKKG